MPKTDNSELRRTWGEFQSACRQFLSDRGILRGRRNPGGGDELKRAEGGARTQAVAAEDVATKHAAFRAALDQHNAR